MSDLLDIKLPPKQKRLLEVLASTEYSRETNKKKAEIAGVSEVYYYEVLKQPNFVQALRLRGLTEAITYTVPIVNKMCKSALAGKFMEGKTMLELAGLGNQGGNQPIINVLINAQSAPKEDLDAKIMAHIIDVQPK